MNKFLKLAAAAALALSFAACSSSAPADKTDVDKPAEESTTLKVGATTAPHAEILKQAVEPMKEAGYDLEIVEFSDYPNINPSTSDGSLDANYFQHEPYLISYDADNNLKSGDDGYLVSAFAVHYEPLGIYSDKHDSATDVPENAKIAVPNDATNEGRALFLLEALGIIGLPEDADPSNVTASDITDNPKNVEIIEIAADQVASKLPDVDFAVINGNYALASEVTDKILESEATVNQERADYAKEYANIIAVKESRKDDPAVQALITVLGSDDIKEFIQSNYKGTVLTLDE